MTVKSIIEKYDIENSTIDKFLTELASDGYEIECVGDSEWQAHRGADFAVSIGIWNADGQDHIRVGDL